MDNKGKKCPDCGQPMKAIRVLHNASRSDLGIPEQGELHYTVSEAKQSVWTGLFSVAGKIAAYMCDGCGHILLYGDPRKS